MLFSKYIMSNSLSDELNLLEFKYLFVLLASVFISVTTQKRKQLKVYLVPSFRDF